MWAGATGWYGYWTCEAGFDGYDFLPQTRFHVLEADNMWCYNESGGLVLWPSYN